MGPQEGRRSGVQRSCACVGGDAQRDNASAAPRIVAADAAFGATAIAGATAAHCLAAAAPAGCGR